MNYRYSVLFSLFASSMFISPASADIDPDNVAKATAIIKDMAVTICGDMDYTGYTKSSALSAEATVKVNSLLKQVAEIGGSVKGDISNKGYYGVLQEQLGTTIKDNQECRKHVWDDLKVMFVKPVTLPEPESKPTPPPQPNLQIHDVECSPVMIGADHNTVTGTCSK
ncbi:hypothetical protein [Klebsiella pneumoniae]|uniref:hypothetical protein n=1 Tax=Klebsiella pneumoniae TaxID=573 RepID=UPI001033039B|nr:hypothetical protein [Klebsiella pneumoniae]